MDNTQLLIGASNGLFHWNVNNKQAPEQIAEGHFYGITQANGLIFAARRSGGYVDKQAPTELVVIHADSLVPSFIKYVPDVIDVHQIQVLDDTHILMTSTGDNSFVVFNTQLWDVECKYFPNPHAKENWDTDHFNSFFLYRDGDKVHMKLVSSSYQSRFSGSIWSYLVDPPSQERGLYDFHLYHIFDNASKLHNVYVDNDKQVVTLSSGTHTVRWGKAVRCLVGSDLFLRGLAISPTKQMYIGATKFAERREQRDLQGHILRMNEHGNAFADNDFLTPAGVNAINEIRIHGEPDSAHPTPNVIWKS